VARLDFANARVAARRARLVGVRELRALLARPTPEARLEALRPTALGAALPAEPRTGDGAPLGIETGLRLAVRRDALRLLEDVEGSRARMLLEAFLALDEAELVKAVLRGVAAGAPLDRTLAAVPLVPRLPESAVRAAAAAATLDAALSSLEEAGSTVAGAVRALPVALERQSLLALELAADRAAVERARLAARRRGEDAAILARHVSDRVDVRNASTVLALAGGTAEESWFLPGGRRFTEAALRGLAASPPAVARSAIAKAFRTTEVALATPWGAHRALERSLLAEARREARARPLSLAVPLAYLLERRAEVERVALVLRGAALGMPGDEILDLADA
jgi:V/A-type H+-transporting ATPase subunit C